MGSARVYRIRLSLRLALLAAVVAWGAMLAFLARFPGVAPRSRISAVGFLAFFVLFSLYYDRLAIAVTAEGIVVSRFFHRLLQVPFEDILRIEVRNGIGGTIYQVLTRRGLVHFSSLLARHRELFKLLLEKAELEPQG